MQEQGLEAFFELQQVSGDDQIYCSRCDEKQNANIVSDESDLLKFLSQKMNASCSCSCFYVVSEKWEITQHPDVLTLLLKRFTFDYKLRRYVKLHCKADVPQTLHMEVFKREQQQVLTFIF